MKVGMEARAAVVHVHCGERSQGPHAGPTGTEGQQRAGCSMACVQRGLSTHDSQRGSGGSLPSAPTPAGHRHTGQQLPPAEGAGSLGPTVAKRSCITHLHPQPACGHPQVGPLQAPGPAQVRPHPPPLTTRGRPHAMPSRLCGSRGEWARAPAPLPVTSGILSARLAPSPPCHRPTPICCAFLGDV